MEREDVTDPIRFRERERGLRGSHGASAVGQSEEGTTAAGLGRMQTRRAQAETVGELFRTC